MRCRFGLMVLLVAAVPAGGAAAGADTVGTADDSDGKLSEVVVTAQKRVEKMQDVPLSLQVVGSDTLAQQNQTSLEEIGQTLPGLHVVARSNSNLLNIRGVGSGENS